MPFSPGCALADSLPLPPRARLEGSFGKLGTAGAVDRWSSRRARVVARPPQHDPALLPDPRRLPPPLLQVGLDEHLYGGYLSMCVLPKGSA